MIDRPYTEIIPENEQVWLEERRNGIGASDIATILGMNPWQTPLQLYAVKIGVDAVEETEAMRDGRDMEPIVSKRLLADAAFRERYGPCKWMPGGMTILRSVRWPWMQATLDGWVERMEAREPMATFRRYVPVELKTTGRPESWADGVPPHYFAQVQHQLAVTGEPASVIACKSYGREIVWQEIERDETYIEGVIVPAAKAFYDRVKALQPPEPHAGDKGTLCKIYPMDDGETVQLHADMIAIDIDLQRAKMDRAALDRLIETKENHIRAAIGKASEGYLPNGTRYTNKVVRRQEHMVAASESRVLRRYEPKGDARG